MHNSVRTIYKKIIAVVLCVMMLPVIVASPAQADEAENRTVTVGVFEFDGYHMRDEEGVLTGYGIELLSMIERYSHLNFELVGYDCSWGEMLEMLDNGEIDMVTSARATNERREKYNFSLPIGTNKTVLSVRLNNKTILPDDFSTYDGMRVGVVSGSSQNDKLRTFAQDNHFTYEEVVFDDPSVMAEALQTGEIDAILSSDLRKAENEKVIKTIESNEFYVIVRKDETDLIKEIDYAIEQIDAYEGDWQNILYHRYYGPENTAAFGFTAREESFIEAVKSGKKTVTATAIPDRMPYSYVEDGQLKGILVDYFADVMAVTGMPFELVVPESPDAYLELVESNAVDVVIDTMVYDDEEGVSEEGEDGFITERYMDAGYNLVTGPDFDGTAEVIAVDDEQTEKLIGNFLDDDVEIVRYPSTQEALEAVASGKVDAAYVYSYAAQLFINRDETNQLHFGIGHDLSTGFAMFVRKTTDHELVTILDKSIELVPRSKLDQLVSEYTTYSLDDLSFFELIRANPAVAWFVGIAILAVCLVILVLFMRNSWNQRLLNAKEKSNEELSEQLAIVDALSRDYTNVYAVDVDRKAAKIIKLEGYVTEGLTKDTESEFPYGPVLTTYIDTRVHPEDQAMLKQELSLDTVLEKLNESDEYTGVYRILVDGEEHHYQYSYTYVKSSSGGHFLLAGFRNIDDTIRHEQEQKELLSEALAQAQYANRAKTTFLNNMSHDIRTPMNAIIGFTSLATANIENTNQVQDYLGKIMTSSNHLLSLINDVLDMSRIESGKVQIEEKEASLPDIMHDLKVIVQADIKAKRLEFYIDTLDVQNEIIICDKLRLNQVLLNILSNAMKYTRPGGLVSVRIVQTTEAHDGYADYEFHIKDTGIGMSDEFLKHVFDPFERENTATVSGIQGTGLGLAITKNIVDIMGGTIAVESEKGVGSEFIVKFRFRVADVSPQSQYVEELADLRALVVDDDIDTCMSVSKMLSTIGMRPDWTTLGKEAVIRTQFAMDQNDPYSAFIIDWLMPDMNGIETVRRIRKVIGDLTPIIVLTAYDWAEIEEEAREAGVTAFCSKPLFMSELRDILLAPSAYGHKTPDPEPEEEPHFEGKKILLVEDNELNLEIAQALLERAGIEVDTADDGVVALEKMEQNPAGTYDMVLTDVQMPIMDGYELTRSIRALDDPGKASICIVAMTANAFEEDREEAMAAGMDNYVSKPIHFGRLMEVLQEML